MIELYLFYPSIKPIWWIEKFKHFKNKTLHESMVKIKDIGLFLLHWVYWYQTDTLLLFWIYFSDYQMTVPCLYLFLKFLLYLMAIFSVSINSYEPHENYYQIFLDSSFPPSELSMSLWLIIRPIASSPSYHSYRNRFYHL